jgi:hypothetical protein
MDKFISSCVLLRRRVTDGVKYEVTSHSQFTELCKIRSSWSWCTIWGRLELAKKDPNYCKSWFWALISCGHRCYNIPPLEVWVADVGCTAFLGISVCGVRPQRL